MNRLMMYIIALGAMVMTGCISVESTRAQLASGDPAQVAKAEENIFSIAVTGQNGLKVLPSSERVDYINLTSNQELLTKIFAEKYWDEEIGIAVAKKMVFSKQDSIVNFIAMHEKQLDEADDEVQSAIVSSMLETAPLEELVRAGRYLTIHYPSFFELRDPLAMKLARVATNQKLLFHLVDGTSNAKLLCFGRNDEFRDVALAKISDQKLLMSLYCDYHCYSHEKVLAKISDETLCDFIVNDSRLAKLRYPYEFACTIMEKNIWAKALTEKKNEEGAKALIWSSKLPPFKVMADVIINAKNDKIKILVARELRDYNAIASVLMDDKVTNEELQLLLVDHIKYGEAQYEIYKAVKNPVVKKALLEKVSNECRAKIRQESRGACEKLIAAAKGKSAETFELGGFYLGMKIEDAEMLIGYHFPEIAVKEDEVDGYRILSVQGQFSPLCYARKNGTVFQLNFGRKMLKKWYKFDVQTYGEWANAYGKETNVRMRYDNITKTATVRGNDGTSVRVRFEQETYQYKHNTKDYRITYYGMDKEPALQGLFSLAEGTSEAQMLKMLVAKEFMHIRSDPGTLRVMYEED